MLYVRGKPASHRGADCCDYTKNKTRKNMKISEKKTVSERCVYVCQLMCVLHHYEKPVSHRETRV